MPGTPITAYAAYNALGVDTDAVLDGVIAGRSGLRMIDNPEGPSRHWGRAVDPPELPKRFACYESRAARFIAAALREVLEPVAVARRRWGAHRVALVLGSAGPDIAWLRARAEPVSPDALHAHGAQGPMLMAREMLGVRGPAYCVAAEGAAGAAAIAAGHRLLTGGFADAVVTGGVGALSSVAGQPYAARRLLGEGPARPLCASRSGSCLGEGAALLLLERHADSLLELVATGEAQRSGAASGAGAAAMRTALANAGLQPEAIGFVQVLAPATITHDFNEAAAVRECFGTAMPVASTMGAIGWVLGAAGATEAIVAAASVGRGVLPPTAGCDPIDGTLEVAPVPQRRELECDQAMVHAATLSGRSIALIVGARQ